jgi:hypothetical protein
VASSLSLPVAPGADAADERERAWSSLAIGVLLACYLLAAVAVTARLWADPASRMVTGNPNDNDYFAWMMRYSATAVTHGHLPPLISTAMNAPQGISLMWNNSMLLLGSLLTPVTLAFGPQTSLTVLLTAGFAGSAASMALVLRRWHASLPAAAIGGAVYGFSPALLQSSIGHYNLQFAVLPPVIVHVGLLLCLGKARPLRAGPPLGVLVAAQLFISAETLLETALAGVLIVAVLAASRPREIAPRARQAAAGLAVAAATIAVLAGWALWIQFFGPLTEHGSSFLFDFYKTDVTGFITPSGLMVFHTGASAADAARYQGGSPEYLAYLGMPLLTVLIAGAIVFWRQLPVRTAAVTWAVLSLLSLGVHPLINGVTHYAVTLPWRWLADLPVLSAALPNRLAVVADGAAAAAFAFALDAGRARLAGSRGMPYLVTGVALAAVLPLLPLSLPAQPTTGLPAGWTATFTALRLPPGARVLVVPVPTATLTDALRWQAETGERISLNAGYFQGPASSGQAYVEGNGLPALAYYLDNLWAGNGAGSPPADVQAEATLAQWNPDAVVADAGSSPMLERYLERLLGPPTIRASGMLGWRINPRR